ncbi:ATP-binding protein [Streptomyces boluensis]|uniref:ATP-binding protein n=1 Tax=Streptomyces boluensis TaxID=1775135 RepID=A0A964XJW2_9ACTN|nr:ATP-binding protein [Streptomyces boluensis]NBE50466.1 ATP-binding protein [Streptomyces boluensis]
MPKQWAGRSIRDQAVLTYLKGAVLPRRHEAAARAHRTGRAGRMGHTGHADDAVAQPFTLVLGPRGSGKTTLLDALAASAALLPMVHLDLARFAHGDKQPVDVLHEVAFTLQARRESPPHLALRGYELTRKALTVPVGHLGREDARRAMADALAIPLGRRLATAIEIGHITGPLVGLPPLATAVLQLIPLAERTRAWGRLRAALGSRERITSTVSALDKLVAVSSDYHVAERGGQPRAEREIFDTFLTDLVRAYDGKAWAARCLVLLDNVDNPLGRRFLELLDAARTPHPGDPLVVFATTGSYPDAAPQPGPTALGRWQPGRPFEPQPLDDGRLLGRLRDLTLAEVREQAQEVFDAVLSRTGPPVPRVVGVSWLGWIVHALTHGHPAATTHVLARMLDCGATAPWDERLRAVLEPGPHSAELLERLLPLGVPHELRRILEQAAVAPDLAESLVGGGTPDGVAGPPAGLFAFCSDPLRTLHIDTGNEDRDGGPGVPHPVLRRLLLGDLDTPGDEHARRRAAARERGDQAAEAYHALALGELPFAAAYLDDKFQTGDVHDWCAELCRLRRAPLPPAEEGERRPWRRYEALVRHLNDDSVGPRLRTITRLLAASWISPEPPEDPATDLVGDPYGDPLADPYAELYPEINARFNTLAAAHTGDVVWVATLLQKAQQYNKEPW